MTAVYIACAVDLNRRVLAQSALQPSDDEAAKKDAELVVVEYPVIEVWQKYQRVGRMVRRD